MKKHNRQLSLLILPLLVSTLTISCVTPGYQGGGNYSSGGGGHVVYTALPNSFVGSAYYHDGRYYSGGRYQTGRYSHGGRFYANRYYYNGRYFYGGNYQQHAAKRVVQEQPKNRKSTGSHR